MTSSGAAASLLDRSTNTGSTTSASAAVDVLPVEGQGAISALAMEWDALASSLGADPFLRPRWFELWWRSFGTGDPLLLTARRDGRLTGVLALERRRGVVRSMSNEHSVSFDALAADEGSAVELWSAAIRSARRHLDVREIRDGPGVAALRDAADRCGRRPWVRKEEAVPSVDVASQTWDEHRGRLSKNLRRDLARRRRRLEESGTTSLRAASGAAVPEAFERAMRIEASGWKGEAGTAMLCAPATRDFYRDLVRWGADEGWLRVLELRHDDQVISFHLVIQHDGTWYPVKGGYDEAYGSSSPGMLMIEEGLEAAFRDGIERYDFAGAANPAIERWADDATRSLRIDVFHPVAGAADRLALAVGRPVAKRVRDALPWGRR